MRRLEQFDYEKFNERSGQWEYQHSRISVDRRAAVELINQDDIYKGEPHLWRVKRIGVFSDTRGKGF